MPTNWYYKVMNAECGPLTATQLRDKASKGEITVDTWIRKGSDGKWVTADRVAGLFQTPGSASSVSGAGTTSAAATATPPLPSTAQPSNSAPSATTPTTKLCPFCAESVAFAAKKCKHCGEFFNVTTQSQQRVANISRSSDPERVIWESHPDGFNYFGHWLFGVVLLPFFGLGLILILYAVVERKSIHYSLSNKRVLATSGIIAHRTDEVRIADIRNITMAQGIWQRLGGVGSVLIGSAGHAGIEVEFRGVKHPHKVRDLVRKATDELSEP